MKKTISELLVNHIFQMTNKSEFIYGESLFEKPLNKTVINQSFEAIPYSNINSIIKIKEESIQFYGAKARCIYDVNSSRPQLKVTFKFHQGQWEGYVRFSTDIKQATQDCELEFKYFDGFSSL